MYFLLFNIFISGIISKIPETRDVLQLLSPIAARWYEIGISLYIEDYKLDELTMSPVSNIQRLHKVIQIWLDESDSPTWSVLIEQIEGPILRNRHVAMEIRKYLSRPEVYEKYVSY